MTRDDLANALTEFDPSDDYHSGDGELDDRSYYAAIDRAVRLIRGEITGWTDAR